MTVKIHLKIYARCTLIHRFNGRVNSVRRENSCFCTVLRLNIFMANNCYKIEITISQIVDIYQIMRIIENKKLSFNTIPAD